MANPNPSPKTRFKPGESGNPQGRPAGTVSLLTILKRKLDEVPEGQRKTYAEGLVDATLRDALQGDSQARKLIWEYVEGRAMQAIELTGRDGGPIQHEQVEQLTDEQLDARIVELAEEITREAAGASKPGS